MDQDEFVRQKDYQDALAAQFGLIQQLLSMVLALTKILTVHGLLTPELWAQCLNQAEMSEQAQKVREAAGRLRGGESIEDILKDFEGPLQ